MFYKAFFLHHFVHTAGLLPFLVEIDLLRLIIHQCSGTHKPVLWISLGFINRIHLKQSCLKVHHMDSIEAYFKIILHTTCIINVCDRDSRRCRCIKLYNTGNVPAEDVRWMEASASMPLAAKIVQIGPYGLLDGGVSDSIPIRFFESIGYKRNLIILTQPKGFVKKKNPLLPAIRARYLRYPAFVEAVADRHERYNETLSYISMLEQAGADYVIRPPIPLEIGAMERDPDQLRRVYETGRAVAQIQIDKIKAFLDAAKAEPEA